MLLFYLLIFCIHLNNTESKTYVFNFTRLPPAIRINFNPSEPTPFEPTCNCGIIPEESKSYEIEYEKSYEMEYELLRGK